MFNPMAEVRLEPDGTAEGNTVQSDGRVYLSKDLAGKKVNVYAEIVDDVDEDGDA